MFNVKLIRSMAIKIKFSSMKVGFGDEKREAFVGKVQLGDTVDTDMLVEQIHLRTGMPEAQIRMLLDNMTDSIAHFFKMGNGVRVGKLGIIKPTISSKSAADADDVKIEKLRFRYLPSTDMKNVLDDLELRRLGDPEGDDADDDDDDDEGGSGNSGGGTSGGGGEELT